jgi:hypothetical protein
MEPFHVYTGKDDEFIAQIKFVAMITPSGVIYGTQPVFDANVYKTDKKVQDAEIKGGFVVPVRALAPEAHCSSLALLSQSLKKKPAASNAPAAAAAAAAAPAVASS